MKRHFTVTLCLLVCVGPLAQTQTLTSQNGVTDTYEERTLNWRVARYTDLNAAGTDSASIQFGLALPRDYASSAEQKYPLILYLHGAGGRGSSIRSMLQRQTPRVFAWNAQAFPQYAAFVLAPQVPAGELWVNQSWTDGPYEQTAETYTDSMALTDRLIEVLIDSSNNPTLEAMLGIDANDIDIHRIYVVGDSMGAYGTWDTIARHPGRYAAAIAAAGSGPTNKLQEILQTPLWLIHGTIDTYVPNALPSAADPDGEGSLGMLALLDPNFTNTGSTAMVRTDVYTTWEDDPNLADTLIYSEVPDLTHPIIGTEWTTRVSGVLDWLFGHNAPALLQGDLNRDRKVNGIDLKILTQAWLDTNCAPASLCRGADLDISGRVDATDLAVLGQTWRQDNSLMPVAWWTLDHESGEVAYDSVGTNHGLLVYMPENSWTAGRLGQALRFDHPNAHVSIPHQVVSEDFSIVFWLRTSTPTKTVGRSVHWSGGGGLVDSHVSGNADDFGLSLYRANVAFGVGQAGGGDVTILSASAVTDGQWHHVAGVRESATGHMQLYIDGSIESEASGPTGAKGAARRLRMGCIQSSLLRCFAGDLDDVRIYDRVLNPHEIVDLAAAVP